jgi:hypothetical protein
LTTGSSICPRCDVPYSDASPPPVQ